MYVGARLTSYFNPRPREEGDGNHPCCNVEGGHFNPRPREEGDHNNRILQRGACNFNPRPREEGDPMLVRRSLS